MPIAHVARVAHVAHVAHVAQVGIAQCGSMSGRDIHTHRPCLSLPVPCLLSNRMLNQ